MNDMRLDALCRSWEKRAQNMLTESKNVQNRTEKECLQHKAAINLNMASELKSMIFDSLSSGKDIF